MADVLIMFSIDGEEREERWPSIASFRAWALVNQLKCAYTAYEEDDDGEWSVIEKGRAGQ